MTISYPPAREDVMVALFNLFTSRIQVSYPEITTTRRMKYASAFGDNEMPAVVMREHDEIIKQPGRGLPEIRTYMIFFIAYVRNDNNKLPGACLINPLLDAVCAALAPDDILAGTITLSVNGADMAYRCEIEGQIVKETGDIDENVAQAFAIVPVKLVSS